MDLRPALGIAVALMAAPVPALAQSWPASAVTTTGYSALNPAPQPRLSLEAPVWREPPAQVAAWIPPSPAPPALKPPPPAAEPLPEAKVPAKPEWTDDQGFRLHYAEITYKQRF